MALTIDRESATPLFLQIAHALRAEITAGLRPEGHRLPPERELARTLAVNRSTILAAYAALKADGLVDAHVGRGTVVLPQRFAARAPGAAERFSRRQLARRRAPVEPDPIIRDLLELAGHRDVVPLSVGLPAPELVPVATIRAIQDRLLAEHGAEVLQHSPTEGLAALRESLQALLAARGIACDPGEILVTSGSQQGLGLIRRVLLEPDDVVVVEEPTFFGALGTLRHAEVRLIPVPVDDEGLRVDVLEEILGRHRPKLIYTLPTYQNLSGASLSLERRHRVLELATCYGVPIVEDDLCAELRCEGPALPPLRALDRLGYVVHLMSKVLFPGFRLGWIVAPRPLARSLALARQALDLHSNTFGQWVLDALLRAGYWPAHVETLRAAYGQMRDAMLAALARAPARAHVAPAGGRLLRLVQLPRPRLAGAPHGRRGARARLVPPG